MDSKIDLNLDAMANFITKLDCSKYILNDMNKEFVNTINQTREKIANIRLEKQIEVEKVQKEYDQLVESIRRMEEAASRDPEHNSEPSSFMYDQLRLIDQKLIMLTEQLNGMLAIEKNYYDQSYKIGEKQKQDSQDYELILYENINNLNAGLDLLRRAKQVI